jgi:hypothetical protein
VPKNQALRRPGAKSCVDRIRRIQIGVARLGRRPPTAQPSGTSEARMLKMMAMAARQTLFGWLTARANRYRAL